MSEKLPGRGCLAFNSVRVGSFRSESGFFPSGLRIVPALIGPGTVAVGTGGTLLLVVVIQEYLCRNSYKGWDGWGKVENITLA